MLLQKSLSSFIVLLSLFNTCFGQAPTIKNPVAPDGRDPWVVQKDGFYYYCYSHDGSIWVNKNKLLQEAVQIKGKNIWTPEPNMPYSKQLWAPELHFIQTKWYVYVAADDGDNKNHRMYVLQSKTDDPMGEYVFKGKISSPSDKWAIDGTVLEHEGQLYFICSGWHGDTDVLQDIYIAKMKGPTSVVGKRVLISKPEYDWERIGQPFVNEGPQVLKNKDQAFVLYSASGSWTDYYCLGQLKLIGDDPLRPESWLKSRTPVFSSTATVFSPGHVSFVKSPDGKEDWVVYHTAKHKGAGWDRDVNIKKFIWDSNGNPCFGSPTNKGTPAPAPSN